MKYIGRKLWHVQRMRETVIGDEERKNVVHTVSRVTKIAPRLGDVCCWRLINRAPVPPEAKKPPKQIQRSSPQTVPSAGKPTVRREKHNAIHRVYYTATEERNTRSGGEEGEEESPAVFGPFRRRRNRSFD